MFIVKEKKIFSNQKLWLFALLMAFICASFSGHAQTTDQMQWHKMLTLLHIQLPDSLPPKLQDPNRPPEALPQKGRIYLHDSIGRSYVRSPWGNWSNYNESKTGNYTLLNPLILNNGKRVKNAKTWWRKRRPQILNAFYNNIYGRIPKHTPKVHFKVAETDSTVYNGTAILEKVAGHVDNSAYPAAHPNINICLFLPTKAKGPVPLIVQITPGNSPFSNPLKDKHNAYIPIIKKILALGWGFATVNPYTIQADNAAGLTKGIIGLVNKGKMRKPDQWGTLAAWSWGLSRALDYFQKDAAINPKEIGIQGHSRWGKTALLAAALDQRWAIVFSICSGAMGASLEKRNFGEIIDNVASAKEYHWMAGNFLKYANHWNKMPTDAHELIALVAPRPVFITGGTKDDWSDPHGEFLACVTAGPVYRLLGKKGLGTDKMPAPGVALTKGQIAFREHKGGHTDIPDWPTFLKFAQKYFGK